MTPERPSRATEAFFGRRRGKALRPQQQAALDKLLPRLKIDIHEPPPSQLQSLFGADVDDVRLEIGFGGGEHLLHRAGAMPRAGFIGVEPFHNGMAKLLSALQTDPLHNVRVYDDDATQLLDWLPDGSLAGIDLLYPDPWPKKKHWKRRFVGEANLDRFARVLRPGGEFRFASDIDTYVNWSLLACRSHPAFDWTARSADDWREPFAGWPGTRYEAKAIREGRTPAYLMFRRL
ncbi:MAG: tRNA (guanosine(46)-N(7))-methyltransferase TrmB [Rhizobiaceae bacterium]